MTSRVAWLDAGGAPAAADLVAGGGVVPVERALGAAWKARATAWCADGDLIAGWCLSSASLLRGSPLDATLACVGAAGLLDPDRLERARLMLTEALANALLHGNLEDEPPGSAPPERLARGVGLCAMRDGDAVRFAILQEGPGMQAVADGLDAAVTGGVPDLSTPGGLGLYVVARSARRWAVDVPAGRLQLWI